MPQFVVLVFALLTDTLSARPIVNVPGLYSLHPSHENNKVSPTVMSAQQRDAPRRRRMTKSSLKTPGRTNSPDTTTVASKRVRSINKTSDMKQWLSRVTAIVFDCPRARHMLRVYAFKLDAHVHVDIHRIKTASWLEDASGRESVFKSIQDINHILNAEPSDHSVKLVIISSSAPFTSRTLWNRFSLTQDCTPIQPILIQPSPNHITITIILLS